MGTAGRESEEQNKADNEKVWRRGCKEHRRKRQRMRHDEHESRSLLRLKWLSHMSFKTQSRLPSTSQDNMFQDRKRIDTENEEMKRRSKK